MRLFTPLHTHSSRITVRLTLALIALTGSACATHLLPAQPGVQVQRSTATDTYRGHEAMLDSLERFFVFSGRVETPNPVRTDLSGGNANAKRVRFDRVAIPLRLPSADVTPAARQLPEAKAVPVTFWKSNSTALENPQKREINTSKTDTSDKSSINQETDGRPGMIRYTVVSRDTMSSIAHVFMGDANLWRVIWKANPEVSDPAFLVVGQVLNVPTIAPAITPVETPTPVTNVAPGGPDYRVVAGDTLGKLAQTYLGNAARWQEIYAANPALTDPNRIMVGQRLAIPGWQQTRLPGVAPHDG